jgi:hypothetical protein
MNSSVAIIGAGGKMGTRICANLRRHSYKLFVVENAKQGTARLREDGMNVTPAVDCVPESDFVVFAVPDARMSAVTHEIVPLMKAKSIAILLDPAAPYEGEMMIRGDCSFVVTHPCHPPLFGEEDTREARKDYFGGVHARQDIVVALHQGDEDAYRRAEVLCREMFAPVNHAYRVTVEQMALLEPAMSEVCAATAAKLMKDAMDEAIARGVPAEAARAFMLGHAQIPLAIVFGEITSPFSDGARIAMKVGTEKVLRADWKRVFEAAEIHTTIHRMLHPEQEK